MREKMEIRYACRDGVGPSSSQCPCAHAGSCSNRDRQKRDRDRDTESRYQQEASVLVCASWSDDSRSRSSCAEENRTNKGCCRIITIAHTCGSYSSSSSSDTCRHHHQYHHCRPLGRRLSSSPHFLSTADTNSLLLLSSKVRRGKGREGKKN